MRHISAPLVIQQHRSDPTTSQSMASEFQALKVNHQDDGNIVS